MRYLGMLFALPFLRAAGPCFSDGTRRVPTTTKRPALRNGGSILLAAPIVLFGLGAIASGQSDIHWRSTLDEAKRQAAESRRPVLVYIRASWCTVCRDNEHSVLRRADVVASVHASSVPVKIDYDHSPELVRHFGIRSVPAILVLAPEGTLLDRIEGRIAPEHLANRLQLVAAQLSRTSQNARAPNGSPSSPEQFVQNISVQHPPPLAMDGYCVVSLSDDLLANRRRWVLGQKAHGVIHRGRTYLFADADKAARFFHQPDGYAPVLSGQDVVLAVDKGRYAEGQREYGAFFGSRIYLFSSEATLQQFENHPNRYADAAMRLVARPKPVAGLAAGGMGEVWRAPR